MGRHRFEIRIAAPIGQVFDLYTNLERMHEWTGGVTGITDISGPVTKPGSTYTVLFGRMRSPTTVVAADPPRLFKTRFGNPVLRGTSETTFHADGDGTHMVQEFQTQGLIPGLMGRIFSLGSYRGSFRGELHEFARIAQREAARPASLT